MLRQINSLGHLNSAPVMLMGCCSFAGLFFFISVDNLTFEVGHRGFLGKSIQKAYSTVNLKVRSGRMPWVGCVTPYLLFVLPCASFFVWAVIQQQALLTGPNVIEIDGVPPFIGGVVGVYERMDYMISSRPVYRQAFIENSYYVATAITDGGIRRRDSQHGQAFLDSLRRISLHSGILQQCRACPDCAMMLHANGACFFKPRDKADSTKGPTLCDTVSKANPSSSNSSRYADISPLGTVRFAKCEAGGKAVAMKPGPREAAAYENSECRMHELGDSFHHGYCDDESTVRTGSVAALNYSLRTLQKLPLISELPASSPSYAQLLALLKDPSPQTLTLSALAESANAILKSELAEVASETFLAGFEGNREKSFHYFLYCNSKFVILRRAWDREWRPSAAGEQFPFLHSLSVGYVYAPSNCSDALVSSEKTEKFSALKLQIEWSATDPKRGDVSLRDFTVKQVSLPRMFGDDDPNDDMCHGNQDNDQERDLMLGGTRYATCKCKDDRFGPTCALPRVCPRMRFTGLPGGFPSNFYLLSFLTNGSFNFELVGGLCGFRSVPLDRDPLRRERILGMQGFPSTTATSNRHATRPIF